jgi:general secretion pathway protein F
MKFKVYHENNFSLESRTLEASSLNSLVNHNNLPKNIIHIMEIKKFQLLDIFIKDETLDLIYEFKTMLNSKLQFESIVEILLKTNKNKNNQKLLQIIHHALLNGQKVSSAFRNNNFSIKHEMILFFKLSENNSNLQSSINALYEILHHNKKIKDDFLSTISYPLILLLSLIISIIIIFIFVIPKFENIYTSFDSTLPYSTEILLDIKYLLFEYYFYIIIFIVTLIIMFKFIYTLLQSAFDKILLLKIPIFSTMYRNILFYKLFLSLHLVVKSKHKFYNALDDSKGIIHNKYLYTQLVCILKDLNNGISINKSFENTKIFDLDILSLLAISQESDNIEDILYDIKNIYSNKVIKSMQNVKAYFEPFLIFIMASIILFIVLALMTPIWDLSTVIN